MHDGRQNALERLHKDRISAGDIATQLWCEKQMELNYLHGKRFTAAMKEGQEIHEEFQEKVYVHLPVKTRTYNEYLFKTAYENYMSIKRLKEESLCREVTVYGSINGYKVVGKIDELQIEKGKVSILEYKAIDLRNFNKEPYVRPHMMQISLYKKLLQDIRNRTYAYSNFSNSYRLNEIKLGEEFINDLRQFNINYTSMTDMFQKMFDEMHSLPEIDNRLMIRYIDRNSGEEIGNVAINYDEYRMDSQIVDILRYWNGEREARPVVEGEKWKCRPCKFFGKECTVWFRRL